MKLKTTYNSITLMPEDHSEWDEILKRFPMCGKIYLTKHIQGCRLVIDLGPLVIDEHKI